MSRNIEIGICDDDEAVYHMIRCYCRPFFSGLDIMVNFNYFSNGEELLAHQKDIDILFLDIEMDKMSGTDVLEKLCTKSCPTSVSYVIFVSSHTELFTRTYSTKTIGFLTKPFTEKEFNTHLCNAYKKAALSTIIPSGAFGNNESIIVSDIIYIQSIGSYFEIYVQDNTHKITGPVSRFFDQIDFPYIAQASRGTYINFMNVLDINKNIVLLSNNETLELGRSYRENFKDSFYQYLNEFGR